MRPFWAPILICVLASSATSAAFSACGSSHAGFTDATDATRGDGTTSDDSGISSPRDGASTDGSFNDFPQPILDNPNGGTQAVPPNAPSLFGPPSQGAQTGGPCLVEPEIGALYPKNWLRPRFRWNAPSGQNLFELRLHAQNQATDLVVYTTATSWTMPLAVWNTLRQDSNDVPMTVAIRGAGLSGGQISGEALGSNGPIGIAPAEAPGSIVYWTTSNGTSLKGFHMGEETVGTTLVTTQVKQVTLSSTNCVGCHTGSPDGEYAVFTTDVNNWGSAVALVDSDAGAVGAVPSFLGNGGMGAMEQGPLGINALSKAHWSAGDHVMIASDGTGLVWIDLEAQQPGSARGTIARSGTQTGGDLAGAPTWSHDGKTIVYVATNHVAAGRLGGDINRQDDVGARADLFSVPYANRLGGAIAAVSGANDPNAEDYYPAFSPDDSLLAFNKCPNDQNMYNQHQAEVFVIPSAGGTATRLAANDPPACSGAKSPGVTNSWPKWAPAVTTLPDGRRFYWIVFSSTRLGANPQLFVAAVVVDAHGAVDTKSALYLWNQPPSEGNHTPAWEYFNVPSELPK
jgi:hypothetical protein